MTWAWLKTSQGQGKVWRGINKDLGKETSVRENLTLNVKQSSLIYKILFFFGNLQMKFEDQPIFKGLWISLKLCLFGLSYFGLLSHLMMCICIHVFMSCVCVCVFVLYIHIYLYRHVYIRVCLCAYIWMFCNGVFFYLIYLNFSFIWLHCASVNVLYK